MSRPATIEMDIEIEGGVASRDGVYVCGRCHLVAHPSQREIDLAESMPASKVELKCAHCHHRTVTWHPPSQRKPRPVPVVQQPVSVVRGLELFADLKSRLNFL